MEKHTICPNCGRKLTESEIFCYFCEFDIEKLKQKNKELEKIRKKQAKE